MFSPAILDTIARACGTGLADSLVQGTALALFASLLITALRKRHAELRFAVLLAAMVAVASLPLLRLARGSVAGTAGESMFRVADAWVPWVTGIWAIGVFAGLARVGVGVWKLSRIRKGCRELNVNAIAPELAKAAGTRPVKLLVSDEITVPSAVGFFRPAVLLPAWVLEELPVPELQHILVHELSHLRRWDDWTNLLQKLVKAVFFFHPAVWWMDGRLALEREIACDDAVLRQSHNPRAYAECLAHLAERSFVRRGLAMAQAAVGRLRETSRRVARILSLEESRVTPFGRCAATALSVLAIGGVAVLWEAPEVVSFEGAPTMAMHAATLRPAASPLINAAWHMPTRSDVRKSESAVPSARPVPVRARQRVAAHRKPQVLTASSADDGYVTRSVMVVFQQDDQIAVWRITTWKYQPSRTAHMEGKKT